MLDLLHRADDLASPVGTLKVINNIIIFQMIMYLACNSFFNNFRNE